MRSNAMDVMKVFAENISTIILMKPTLPSLEIHDLIVNPAIKSNTDEKIKSRNN
jgi:hypothetical protein